jgi:RNA polymerase sigma-70 factor (ECF subfamily)
MTGVSVLEQETVDRATHGDPAAVDAVLRAIRPVVVRYCRGRIGQGTGYLEADDVAQSVLTAVFQGLSRYQDQGRTFISWVYGIAAHKVLDAQRDAATHNTRTLLTDHAVEGIDPAPGPAEQAEAVELAGWMSQLLATTLPTVQREIVVLRVAVGMTAGEVADVLGMSAGAVRVAQSRALATLRARVGAWDGVRS